jgi:hypothetical protein
MFVKQNALIERQCAVLDHRLNEQKKGTDDNGLEYEKEGIPKR